MNFQAGQNQLFAQEVRDLAEWDVQMKLNFPSGGKYAVFVRGDNISTGDAIVFTSRAKSLHSALAAVGIEGDKVEYSEIDEHLRQSGASPHSMKSIGTAFVVFQPACPHPCCPGPEPINKP